MTSNLHLIELCSFLIYIIIQLFIVTWISDRHYKIQHKTYDPLPLTRVTCLNCDWDAGSLRYPLIAGIDHQKYTGHIVTFSRSDLEQVSLVA